MKPFFLVITFGIFFLSCKEPEKPITIKTNSIIIKKSTENLMPDSLNVYDEFSSYKEAIKLKLKTATPKIANELYTNYFKQNELLLSKILESELPILDKFYSDDPTDKKKIATLHTKLKKNNLEFDELGEGYVEITTISDFYSQLFSKYVTEDYKEYLYVISQENKTTYQSDAGLIITFKELGERIIYWENFINKYPDSKLLPQVKEDLKGYRLDYILGLDNTPTIERAGNVDTPFIYPENIAEFNRFNKKYPDSPTNTFIKIFRENYKNDNIYNLLEIEINKQ